MKILRLATLVAIVAFLGACYDPNKPPQCDPSTIDYPRCLDPTLPAKKAPPKLGASLIYPGAATLSSLGLTDLRSYAMSRAARLLGISSPTVILDDSFATAPGTANSFWNTTSGTISDVARNGAWKRIATAAGAGSTGAARNGQAPTVVTNVGTQKWYMLWRFAVTSAIDANTRVEIGFIDTGLSADQPTFGVQGGTSTTFWRFTDRTAGVTSAIAINNGVHIGEMWGLGDMIIRGAIDGEAAVSYTTAKTAAMMPYVQVLNGATAAVQSVDLGHAIYVAD